MLVLSRRIAEAIVLSNGVRVVIADITSGRVKLGIEAPQDVTVLREELLKRRPQECNGQAISQLSQIDSIRSG